MKKFYFIVTILSLSSVFAAAQNRARIFDNFDTSRGVQVVRTPTANPIVNNKSKPLVKKTVQAKMSVQDGFSLKDRSKTANHSKFTMAAGSGLKGFTTGSAEYDSYIVDSSKRYAIDPLLIYAQMHQESSFKLKATSHKGASGLMQLMPATARRFGVTEIYNPRQNIEAGIKYMRWLLDTFNGDVVLALAGYNAGEGAVMKYGWQIPPYRETQEYVRRITSRYNSISDPMFAKTVQKVSSQQAAKLEVKASAPLTTFEPNALAIKLSDGRMRLVNQ
ncbi:MAG: lytic transglycosylase domain-containing protein [Acidobacteriota bacterium]|nr:lytic transglycosylase domain-containing protein [Acidobacteriota bacterium]